MTGGCSATPLGLAGPGPLTRRTRSQRMGAGCPGVNCALCNCASAARLLLSRADSAGRRRRTLDGEGDVDSQHLRPLAPHRPRCDPTEIPAEFSLHRPLRPAMSKSRLLSVRPSKELPSSGKGCRCACGRLNVLVWSV